MLSFLFKLEEFQAHGAFRNLMNQMHIQFTLQEQTVGSVSSLLSSILSLKYKVGLYTSPHLYDYTERIKINKKNITKKKTLLIFIMTLKKMIINYEIRSMYSIFFF